MESVTEEIAMDACLSYLPVSLAKWLLSVCQILIFYLYLSYLFIHLLYLLFNLSFLSKPLLESFGRAKRE